MRKGGESPLTTIANYVFAAFPRSTAKHLERGLNCSPRQAQRIVETGRAPGIFRTALIRLLDEAIARNKSELERLHDELRHIEHTEMVGRAADRRAPTLGAPFAPSSRSGDEQ
jgi:hypothetical protein